MLFSKPDDGFFSKPDDGWYLLCGSVVHAFPLTSRAELLQSQWTCCAQSENRLCKNDLLHRSERKGLLKHVIRVARTSLEVQNSMPVIPVLGRVQFYLQIREGQVRGCCLQLNFCNFNNDKNLYILLPPLFSR